MNLGVHSLQIRDSAEARRRLRLGITRSCDLDCFFCHGDGAAVRHFSQEVSALAPDEVAEVVRVASKVGVSKVKLTGGEPLLYRRGQSRITHVVAAASAAATECGVELSLVTNGIGLTPVTAQELKAAGLARVTVSLHAASAGTFEAYAGLRPGQGARTLEAVYKGIASAVDAQLGPVKVNTVVYYSRTIPARRNLSEIPTILRAARNLGVTEVKLFVVLQNPSLPPNSHEDAFVYWTDRLLDGLVPEDALLGMRELLSDQRLEQFAGPGSFSAVFDVTNADPTVPLVSFQNLKLRRPLRAGEQGECGCQEGAYALRVTPDGSVKSCLWDKGERNILEPLRRGDREAVARELRTGLDNLHAGAPRVVVAMPAA